MNYLIKTVKRRRICAVCSLISVIMLTGCLKSDDVSEDTREYSETAAVSSEIMQPLSEPFSDYTFELRGTKENYMIVICKGSHNNEISVTVENNLYQSKEYIITAPDGYIPLLPFEQKDASSTVNVIVNDIDSTYIPDIIQFSFIPDISAASVDDFSVSERISRMYTVNDKGELHEIKICSYTEEDEDGNCEEIVMDYLDRTQLYHCEPKKFIYEIVVDDKNIFDEENNIRPVDEIVKIKTLTFDINKLSLISDYEEISEENPLYFGYAYWSAANSLAYYFNMTSFNVSDWENYVEKPNPEDNSFTDYYFKIDDSRFGNIDELKAYINGVFTVEYSQKLIDNSPQRYCDINGELYGIAGDGSYDNTLGTLTFSGMEISENRMVFRSRQEKYDDSGDFSGYTDGGNFVIVKDENDCWKVSQYRYPYSFN